MYWNNPIYTIIYPSDSDIIFESLHNGAHCLFYNPSVDKTDIYYQQTLQDLCAWTNTRVAKHGWKDFLNDSSNFYEIANLVKLNLWVHDLPRRGSIKPMLLTYTGGKYNSDFIRNGSGTGSSRLRAMERIPSMQTVSAFITTNTQLATDFAGLESVTTFARFAELCGATPGQTFLFRLTDELAPFGLDWYEYDNQKTTEVTPSEEWCVQAVKKYIACNPDTVFTPEWFDREIDWNTV